MKMTVRSFLYGQHCWQEIFSTQLLAICDRHQEVTHLICLYECDRQTLSIGS